MKSVSDITVEKIRLITKDCAPYKTATSAPDDAEKISKMGREKVGNKQS